MLVWVDTRKNYGETREIGLGMIDGRVMVVGWVRYGGDRIHIFSFRKANGRETQRYKEFLQREETRAARENAARPPRD